MDLIKGFELISLKYTVSIKLRMKFQFQMTVAEHHKPSLTWAPGKPLLTTIPASHGQIWHL